MIKNVVLIVLFVSTAVSQSSLKSQDSSDVLLRFGGDVLLGAHYENDVGSEVNRAFAEFDLFKTDDLSMVNLENPVTTRGTKQKKPFTFRMHPRFIAALKSGGVDVVNIANNHVYDYGRIGLFDTIESLDTAQLPHVGAGRNRDEAHRPVVMTIRGNQIGIVGYYGGPEAPAATRTRGGVADRNLEVIARDIHSLRQKADYIIVNFHWGTEKAKYPNPAQRSFARSVIDAGADAIIGHHPHVLQGIELYKNKVIVYSLGNLVFGGNSRHTYDTGVFEIRLSAGGATSAERRAAYSFRPVRVRHWSVSTLGGADSARVVNEVRNLSAIFPKSIFH